MPDLYAPASSGIPAPTRPQPVGSPPWRSHKAVRTSSRAPAGGTRTPAKSRDLYLDLLRALALGRVVLNHLFGWVWLPIVFPSMGVMFALAGALMARSLARPALSVIRSRLRRLLPPLWLMAALLVPLMVWQGWVPSHSHDPARWWLKLAFWVLPLSDPPFPQHLPRIPGLLDAYWGEHAAGPLWYLRAYLWFVLLSPLLLKVVRKVPWVAILTPLSMCFFLDAWIIDPPERVYANLAGFATYGSCWILGMAFNEGLFQRIRRFMIPSTVPFVMLATFWWAWNHPADGTTRLDLDQTASTQALWSLGFVLLLLNVSPSWHSWPLKLEKWSGLITLLNARAVTVYLWHNLALTVALELSNLLWYVHPVAQNVPWLLDSNAIGFLLTVPMIALSILLFGWFEDVAAKRPVRLFPWPHRQHGGRQT